MSRMPELRAGLSSSLRSGIRIPKPRFSHYGKINNPAVGIRVVYNATGLIEIDDMRITEEPASVVMSQAVRGHSEVIQ